MPRTRRPGTSGREGHQFTGGQYGSGVEQQELERVMPTVRAPGPVAAPPTPGAAPVAAPAPVPQPFDMAAAMAQAKGLAAGGGLLGATDRPDEPVTTGLPVGAGAGPEVMTAKFGSPTLATLNRLYQATGDPMWAKLAASVKR